MDWNNTTELRTINDLLQSNKGRQAGDTLLNGDGKEVVGTVILSIDSSGFKVAKSRTNGISIDHFSGSDRETMGVHVSRNELKLISKIL